MSNKILNLDLSKDPIMPAIVYGRVGDDRLQTVTVNLTRRDEVADLTGYDITFEGTTYNRQTKVFDSNNISSTPEGLKKGTFDYTFPNMAFAVAGKYEQAYFSIVKDGKRDSTTGFEIYVDGNADIDAPEAETIITEYNKLVAELNELQNQAIDEMNRNFTEAQGRISELEVQINDLRNKIDQALTDFENGNFWTKEESFNKEESSANVISQVIGKEKVQLTFKTDFLNKETGNFLENKNIARVFASPTLGNPSTSGNEIGRYDQLSALDGVLYKNGNNVSGSFTQLIAQYDLIELITRLLDERFWIDLGAITILEKANVLKSMLKRVVSSAYGFGKNQDGYKYSQYRAVYNTAGEFTGWALASTHNNSVISKINVDLSTQSQFSTCIDKNGYFSVAIVSEKSDGSTYSELNTDYLHLEFTIELSANEHIKSMIAAYHGENIATKEEALDGKSNDKIMTPLRVANVISTLGSGGNAVASSEEALAGVENTKIMSALRVKEVLDARENEIATSNVFSAAFMRSGQISFMRRGPILIVNGTVTVKTAQAALTDLFVPDLGGKVPLNNAGNILAISDKAPYAKRFLISSNGGNFRTISALEADEYLAFSGSIMLAP